MSTMDLRGVNPAPVTAFKPNGDLDYEANASLARWLASVEGVTSLVILGHAGEGTFLTQEEQVDLIRLYVETVGNKVPIIAGITGEGTKVAALEAKRAADAGATGALVYPNHGWLRFGFQPGAPQDRYKAIHEASGLQCILFQYPAKTAANYDLKTQLEIAALPGVVATKNGVREHAPLVHRHSDAAQGVPGPADHHLPRRVAAADDVRRRRLAGGLWRAWRRNRSSSTSPSARRKTTRPRGRSTTGCGR